MSNINTPQKTPGQLHLADEMNVQTNWTNSPGLQLGTFSPSMVFNSQGNYLDYVATSDIVFTASSIVAFNVRKVKITTDGTHTFSVGGGVRLVSGSLGLIDAGTYDFIFGSFDANEVLLSVPGIAQQPTPTLTTPTLSAVPQSQAITINWSNEDAAQTGRELLRSTTDNISTASPVVGYDGTASYLDDNDGAGLVNGTTYYYWGRNTASGYNPSGYGTTNSTPGTVQLTQPTGLSATGGQESNVPLIWSAIDSNADNVSVERSLTSGSGFTQLVLLAQSATSHDDTTAVNDTQYFYRIIAKGSGNYSDSDPSAEASATPGVTISPEAQAVLNRMTALTPTEENAIITFVDQEVLDGVWTDVIDFQCYALNNTDHLTGFKANTAVSTGTHGAEGITTTGTQYIDTNINFGDNSVTQDDVYASVYHKGVTNTTNFTFGNSNGATFFLNRRAFDFAIMRSGSGNYAAHGEEAHTASMRDGVNVGRKVINGVATTQNFASGSVMAGNLYVGCYNNNGSPTSYANGIYMTCTLARGDGFAYAAHHTNVIQLLVDLGITLNPS